MRWPVMCQGAQFALISQAGNFTGIQGGLALALSKGFTGFQAGAVSIADGPFTGIQCGFVNMAGEKGGSLQLGLFNMTDGKGMQFGFINYSKDAWDSGIPDPELQLLIDPSGRRSSVFRPENRKESGLNA